ncbi:MAG: electron transfer flavoprotein subunit alpha/FixB family protein [Candidatus Marinimicrobia bacterium]|nr:electron transfer flavoprotein subunit alpha/FixB family protein [Candidatus Neomarinimicrobiota bacterium]
MDILVVLESSNGSLHRMSREAIVGAQSLAAENGLSIGALSMGADAEQIASIVTSYNIDEVLVVNNDLLSPYNADGFAECVKQVVEQESPTLVVIGHTYQTRDYFPKVSARLDKPFIPDVISMNKENDSFVFTKTVFNGKLGSEVVSNDSACTLISFQAAAFSDENIMSGSATTRQVDISLEPGNVKSTSEAPFQEEAGGVDLSSADLIVSVGRGIEKEDNIPMAKELANALNGELASSRPVVDAGWLPSSHQVGSSGQSVSPNLYIALGISGAIQHVVGMKGSKNIIAINKDADAPIFEIADYGVVGNVLDIVPKLTEVIKG